MKHILLGFGLFLSALSGQAQVTNTFSGALTAADPTIPGVRMDRSGITAACATTRVYPGVAKNNSIGVRYDSYTITNPSTTTPVCATLTLTPACSEGTSDYLFCSVYLNSFDKTNLATNYRSDMGSSPTTAPLSMGVKVSPGEKLVVVISGVTAASTCSAYSLTVAAPIALSVRGGQLAAAATLSAYPNPVEDVLHITAANAGSYTLYNATGAVVQQIEGSEVSLRNLPGGVYLLQQNTTKAATRIVKL
ncbi:hypothetical protein GCM10022408_29550 [Hymenobacter fastidiosus]|uniref:Secretion system C-terminal sorting domain-containing protein n=1 Tax=Hymenobacter fastidiosus TaxID=486264 RepID=A0ABP7SNY7_9BACT